MILNDGKEIARMKQNAVADIEVVITSYNQGEMILEAIESVFTQTVLPRRIIVVDDGSTDEVSLDVLKKIEYNVNFLVPTIVCYQKNGGVSSARNTGVKKTQTSMILILDGDDKLAPFYIEQVSQLLIDHPSMVAASSWMNMFGLIENTIVRPTGGELSSFLSHNCCPATHIVRKEIFESCKGYDESMCFGFEDWDYFLSLLETKSSASIGIVESPLVCYRTTPISANIKSMNKRLEIMKYIILKHMDSYRDNLVDALLGIESISNSRLFGWENEIIHEIEKNQELSETAYEFMKNPTYGDGGMASAVRIESSRKDLSK